MNNSSDIYKQALNELIFEDNRYDITSDSLNGGAYTSPATSNEIRFKKLEFKLQSLEMLMNSLTDSKQEYVEDESIEDVNEPDPIPSDYDMNDDEDRDQYDEQLSFEGGSDISSIIADLSQDEIKYMDSFKHTDELPLTGGYKKPVKSAVKRCRMYPY